MLLKITKKMCLIVHFIFAILAFFSLNMHAQIATQPLFMQIKSPRVESVSGIPMDSEEKIFFIDASAHDSVDISFLILVPKEMLSEKWAISLTPTVRSTREDGRLKDVVVKGWKFAEEQDDNYKKYDDFMNSIIDSSMYEKMYIDQAKLEKEIEERHALYWKFYYDEWKRQIEYEIWKSKQDGSTRTFFAKDKSDYREQLYNQYLIRIKNQSNRYIKAGMDTIGLHAKYMEEFEIHDSKMPRYFVGENISFRKVPNKFQDIYKSGRTLDDITDSMLELLVKRDSALMALLPALDYGKIIENEKKAMLKEGIFDDLIQLPKNEDALLDTIVYDMRSDYKYIYTYSYPILEGVSDTIIVRLSSKILATDRSGFSSTSENTLTYIVNSSNPKTNKNAFIEEKLLNKNEKVNANDQKISLKELTDRLKKIGTSDQKSSSIEKEEPISKEGLGSRIRILEE